MENVSDLPPGIRPFIQQGVRITRAAESVALDTAGARFSVSGEDARRLDRMLPLLNGDNSLLEIAHACGVQLEEVRAIVEPLYCAALVGERTDESISASLFYEHARQCGALWQGLSAWSDPLPGLIEKGVADQKLVLGILIEQWHYIASNPLHASTAVLNARTHKTRQLWAEFAAEEYAHGAWLEEGLAHVLTTDELRACLPLPGTAALCNQLRWTAQTSELGYAACLALCEQSSETPDANFQTDYYASLKQLAVLPDSVFEPYERHALTDVEANHLAFTRVPFEERGTVNLSDRLEVLGHMWQHICAYELFYRNIYEFYGAPLSPRIHRVPGASLD